MPHCRSVFLCWTRTPGRRVLLRCVNRVPWYAGSSPEDVFGECSDPVAYADVASASWQVICRVSCLVANRLWRRRAYKFPATGGRAVALVGPEASGKSTSADRSAPGCPRPLRHNAFTWASPTCRGLADWPTVCGRCDGGLARGVEIDRLTARRRDYEPRQTVVAHTPASRSSWRLERFHAARAAFRQASRGTTVVCDRYPSTQVGAVDGPRLDKDAHHGVRTALATGPARRAGLLPPDPTTRCCHTVGCAGCSCARRRNRDRVKPDKESDAYLVDRHRRFHVRRDGRCERAACRHDTVPATTCWPTSER